MITRLLACLLLVQAALGPSLCLGRLGADAPFTVPICTAAGLSHAPIEDGAPAAQPEPCPLCFAPGAAALSPREPPGAPTRFDVRPAWRATVAEPAAATIRGPPSGARAPPRAA